MKRHPYIIATVVATLLAVVVWLLVPKEYTAVTKLSDEHEEVDLAIGLDRLKAQIKNVTGSSDKGINNMDIYSKILQSKDFAHDISLKQVPGTGMTYGKYLGQEDTIEAIQDNINFNYSSKKKTLIISFTDRNPKVAAMMLDSITALLQAVITKHRHQITNAALENAAIEMERAKRDYEEACNQYNAYADSHHNSLTEAEIQKEKALEHECTLCYNHLRDITNEYVREMALKQRAYTSFAIIQSNSVPKKINSFFISYLLSFVCIALILTRAYQLYQKKKKRWDQILTDRGDLFSPWCLTIVIWTADILLYYLQGTLDPIGPQFIRCLILWLITFLPASIFAYWLCRDDSKPIYKDHKKPIDISLNAFYFLVGLSLIMTLFYAKTIYGIVSQFDGQNMLFNIRTLALYSTESLGVLAHTQSLNLALFLVAIWLYPRISGWTVALIVVINIILEIAMMEKSGILIMILGALFVLYERGKIRVRTIGLTLVGIVVLFFFFNMSKEDVNSEESMPFMDFFGMYITSPMVAFERLRITISDTFAPNTLNDFYPQLLRFGINVDTIERLQDFVYVPVLTNVYTIMQPFYNDFGTIGVAFFGFLYGSVFGFVYCKFREGSDVYKCFYTYLVEVIIIQFYNENLLQVFHLVLETALIIVLLKVLTRINTIPVSPKSIQHEPVQK